MAASQGTPAGGGVLRRGPGWGTDVLVSVSLIVLQVPVIGWAWLSAGMDGWARGYDDESPYGAAWDQAVVVTLVCAGVGVAVAVVLLGFGRGRRGWVSAVTQGLLGVVLLGGAWAAHREAHPPVAPVQHEYRGHGTTSCTAQAHAKDGCK
ncbi:DUF6234 family protein [Actinomadura napierensis]|uniref:DUF6234 domain-containing protein n=1 Tax=Actinomadura napierensis TaxID=267854 RepID=A0ABN3A214_9ACTN